jgi:hypothetical protein
MKFCILVYAFCILTSVGLSHDVGVDTILFPSGTFDSCGIVIPRCIVANYGDSPTDLWATMTMDEGGGQNYIDSLWLEGLSPGVRETVAFTGCIPSARDSMTAIAWTSCAGDTFPADDTCRQRFLVQVRDIAVTEFTVPATDTVDSGVVFSPQVRVWNFGNVSLNFDVRFRIGVYQATRNLNLIAGGSTLVTAPLPWTAMPGIWVLEVAAILHHDCHPENNVLRETLYVRGGISDSSWVRFRMPPDTIHGTGFTPGAEVHCGGINPASFRVFFSIYDSVGTPELYAESSQVMLGPGDSTYIEFPSMWFSEPGAYLAVGLARIEPGGRVYADSQYFWVVWGGGIGESSTPQASSHRLQATVLRGLPFGAVAFDAMGRKVVNPKPGVYFVREEPQATSPKPQAMRKVVLQR